MRIIHATLVAAFGLAIGGANVALAELGTSEPPIAIVKNGPATKKGLHLKILPEHQERQTQPVQKITS